MTNQFYVEPTKLTLRDKEILISPLKVKKLSQVAVEAAPLADMLAGEISPLHILRNTDAVISLCALATDLEPEWVGELNAAELLELLTVVVETNSDFFIQTVMPLMTKMVQKVGQAASLTQESTKTA